MRNFEVTVRDTDSNASSTKSVSCDDGDITVLRVHLMHPLSEALKEVEAIDPGRLGRELAFVLEKHGLNSATIKSLSPSEIVDAVTKARKK